MKSEETNGGKCHNTGEAQHHFAEWKEPAMKEYTLSDSTEYEILEETKLTDDRKKLER